MQSFWSRWKKKKKKYIYIYIYIYLILKQQYKHLMGDVNIWSRYNKLTRIDSHTDSMQQSL